MLANNSILFERVHNTNQIVKIVTIEINPMLSPPSPYSEAVEYSLTLAPQHRNLFPGHLE